MLRRFSPPQITKHREAAGLTRQQFANRIGRSWWTVYGYEVGKYAPTADGLAEIAHALECSIDDLFAEEPAG